MPTSTFHSHTLRVLREELGELTARYRASQTPPPHAPESELEATVTRFTSGEVSGNYLSLSDHVAASPGFARLNGDRESQASYLKTLTFRLIDQFLTQGPSCDVALPRYAHTLFGKELERILRCLCGETAYEFSLSNEVYRKDLALCVGRMIPAGCQLIETAGVPRRLLLLGGVSQLITSSWFFLSRFRGFAPTFEVHVHTPNRHLFSEEGRNLCYQIVADLLRLNPGFKGLQGASWFYDPALRHVSPHLSYLVDIPRAHRGQVFYLGDEGENSAAFATSRTRRARHRSGEYTPRTFLLAWPAEGVHQHVSNLNPSAIHEYLQS